MTDLPFPGCKNILVVCPHPDDAVLGMGGSISRHLQAGGELHMAFGSFAMPHHGQSVISDRQAEVGQSLIDLTIGSQDHPFPGMTYEKVFDAVFAGVFAVRSDCRLDMESQQQMITWLDTRMDNHKPDALFWSYPSHNQDHVAIANACKAALRVWPSYLKLAGEYEYPEYSVPMEHANFWVHIDAETYAARERAVGRYVSKNGPGWNAATAALLAHTRWRGAQVATSYAEAFRVRYMSRPSV